MTKEALGRMAITPRLDEDIDDISVLINSPPEILSLTADLHEDFIQEPDISEAALSSSQLPSVVWTELPVPLRDRFVRHDDSSLGKQSFDLSEAQTELIIDPDGVADDFRWRTMPEIARPAAFHPAILQGDELT